MAFLDIIAPAVIGSVVGKAADGLFGGSKGGSGAGSPAAAADPFAAQRPQYMDQLKTLMSGGAQSNLGAFSGAAGATPNQDPSYAFRLRTGTDNVQRTMAARGMGGSGNEAAAISDYSQGMASTEYNAQFNRNENSYQNNYARLAQLSGATTGQPGAAGQLLQQQQGNAAAFGQQIGGAVVGAAGNAISAGQDWWNGNQGNLNTPDSSGSTTNSADWGAYNAPLL